MNGFPSQGVGSLVTGNVVPAETTRLMVTGQIVIAVVSLGLGMRIVVQAVGRRRGGWSNRGGGVAPDSAS